MQSRCGVGDWGFLEWGFLQEAGERGGPIGLLFLNTFIAQFHF